MLVRQFSHQQIQTWHRYQTIDSAIAPTTYFFFFSVFRIRTFFLEIRAWDCEEKINDLYNPNKKMINRVWQDMSKNFDHVHKIIEVCIF